MKTKANEGIRELRRVLGQTQSGFAAMIGASKDTVVSWECGRNQLSMTFARRIAIATGVDGDSLLKGISVPFTADPLSNPRVYTVEDFERHRKSWRGRSDEEGARHHLKHCADALELIFMAAVRSRAARRCQQLPAVLVSFIDWCEETRRDFGLEEGIDEQLQKRRLKAGVTQTYREWRAMLRESPVEVRAAGFKDDRSKGGDETLRLELEVVPGWAPGRSMTGPRPAMMVAVAKTVSFPRRGSGGGKSEAGRPVPVKPSPTHHLAGAKDLPPSDRTHSLPKD